MPKTRKKIYSALFDVRPVDEKGRADLGRIQKPKKVLNLKNIKSSSAEKEIQLNPQNFSKPINLKKKKKSKQESYNYHLQENQNPKPETLFLQKQKNKELESIDIDNTPTREEILQELEEIDQQDKEVIEKNNFNYSDETEFSENQQSSIDFNTSIPETPEYLSDYYPLETVEDTISEKDKDKYFEHHQQTCNNKFQISRLKFCFSSKKISSLASFLVFAILVVLVVPLGSLISQGFEIKKDIWNNSSSAYDNLLSAVSSLKDGDFNNAEENFEKAHFNFSKANNQIGEVSRISLNILEKLSLASTVSSGSHLINVGESLSKAGQDLSSASAKLALNNLFQTFGKNKKQNKADQQALTDIILRASTDLNQALSNIRTANNEIQQVEAGSLPNNIRSEVVLLKQKLPITEEILTEINNHTNILLQVLGYSNPRQYLLVFQNNSEMRATGGFFGTYGLLRLDQGKVDKLKIEGVYQVDGQLSAKVIPPRPIQKISTAWSMHDANWFADFPTSARKISWFYEKTGGPTVDGIFTLTPTVMERLLELTGPIEIKQYDISLDASNFTKMIQYKVEVDYDRKLNQPKKILADFAPKFIDRIANLGLQEKIKAFNIISQSIDEKHILFYFKDKEIEEVIQEKGWGGRLMETENDYFSVVNSNINGYKTDKVIEQNIKHQAEIKPDGSVVDTLTVIRKHNGGSKNYKWWNRVNADYLRVYLPKGTELLSVDGQTKEEYQPPIDYQKHNFKEDSLVDKIESTMKIDPETNTRIFEETGKTVFANWVYLSPGEEVKVTYKYKLPFRIDPNKTADNYSLLAQKQAGSVNVDFSHTLKYPKGWQISWSYPDNLKINKGIINYKTKLNVDRFLGATFSF